MTIKAEEQILKIIKYTPSIFIIITSFLITLFFYFENKKTFNNEKIEIEENYILDNKEIIKDEINRIYYFIKHLHETTESELKKNIKSRVYEAHEIVSNIYNNYKNTKTNEEILELIKIALNTIRFNDGRGYYFIYDVNGINILNPIDRSLEGQNLIDYVDLDGYKFFQTMVKTIKEKDERFDDYFWYKPNDKKEIAKKISFYKNFEPLNIAIGTGEYIDDFEKNIQKKALEYIDLVKFGKNGYVFVFDYNKVFLSHINKNIVGKQVNEVKEIGNLTEVTSQLLELAKKEDGYLSYIQHEKPGTNKATKKITYVKSYSHWNWVIGTGFYEDDLLQKIAEKKEKLDEQYSVYIKNILIISIILTFVLLIISRYVSKFLENKFNEYKIELNKNQTILHQQSKMAAMGEMIGNIAHQWRQPLSIITTASSGIVLQKEMGILTDDFFMDALKKINSSAQHLSKTIDDFRNFFDPNKSKSKIYLEDVFTKTIDLISAQFSAKDINIIKNIENIELNSYENELIQALINILNNSRDELIKKPIEEEKYIFIDVYKADNKVNIIIKDNAGGINEEYIDKIFEPYFTTKHKSQGTGIGLYMTEEIIVKHLEGEIFVENKEFVFNDKEYFGASFKIVLNLNDK